MLRHIKELFRIPALQNGVAINKAPLPILSIGNLDNDSSISKLKWSLFTDRSIGGKSEASFEVSTPGNHPINETDGHTGEIRPPSATFSGNLSNMRPAADPTVKRTGYCALKVIMPRSFRVEGYEGLELTVRTDGRSYITNLEVESFFPDELYQGYITGLPAGQWLTIQLPFQDMTLTRLGRMSYIQKELDSTFTLESIGFLIADGKTGPFCLEIANVAAVGRIQGRTLSKPSMSDGNGLKKEERAGTNLEEDKKTSTRSEKSQ